MAVSLSRPTTLVQTEISQLLCADVHVPKRTNPTDVGGPLASPLVPPSGLRFGVKCCCSYLMDCHEILYTHPLSPSGWILITFVIPWLFIWHHNLVKMGHICSTFPSASSTAQTVVYYSVFCTKSFKQKTNGWFSLGTNWGFMSLRVNSSAGSWHENVDKPQKWEVSRVHHTLCLVRGERDQLI